MRELLGISEPVWIIACGIWVAAIIPLAVHSTLRLAWALFCWAFWDRKILGKEGE